MSVARYVVCSTWRHKPVTRVVCDSRTEAEAALERVRREDVRNPESQYWLAELGPECEAWRRLSPKE